MEESSGMVWRRARTRAGKATRGAPKAPDVALVLYLYAKGPTELGHLARQVGAPRERTRRRLLVLWDCGLVSAYATTTWRLTEDGERMGRALYREGTNDLRRRVV